jgi:hypothetical protein
MADFAPAHPGEILRTEFLEPMGISQYRIAKVIDVPQVRSIIGPGASAATISAPSATSCDASRGDFECLHQAPDPRVRIRHLGHRNGSEPALGLELFRLGCVTQLH